MKRACYASACAAVQNFGAGSEILKKKSVSVCSDYAERRVTLQPAGASRSAQPAGARS
jgi:hypothetical protein